MLASEKKWREEKSIKESIQTEWILISPCCSSLGILGVIYRLFCLFFALFLIFS